MAPPCPAQGGVLMHAYNRRVDHLNGGVMDTCQCIHDPLPDACSTSANEAVVASGIRTERLRQVAPWGPRSQDPEDGIEDTAVIHPWKTTRLIRQERLDGR